MGVVERTCPLCGSSGCSVELRLKQEQFTRTNPTYRLDRLERLGLDPDQEYPIVRCDDCAMVYSLYHLDDDREATVYNEIIDEDRSRTKILSLERKRGDLIRCLNLLSLLQDGSDPSELKLLDYGCGWGTLLRVAGGLGIEAIGFDVTSWKTKWARDQGIEIFSSRDEVEDESPFDLLVSTAVLEHVKDPIEAVAWMSRVIRPGGVALIDCVIDPLATPRGTNEIRDRLGSRTPIPKEVNPWEHLNYFSKERLTQMLESHGFRPVRPAGEWLPADGRLSDLTRLVRTQLALVLGREASFGYWRFAP